MAKQKKEKTNKEKFNDWYKKLGGIYYAQNERMLLAYERIIEYEK
jgi:hypothetical protein